MGGSTRAAVTPLERALAHLLGTLLDASEIGIEDDFLSIGGDTEIATAAAARIQEWLDIPTVTAADVSESRTVAALAELLRNRDARLEQVAELFLEVAAMDTVEVTDFAPWVRRFPGPARGGIVIFPHAGSAAAAYRPVACAFAADGPDVFVVQYPQHAGRLSDPAAPTVTALAEGLFAAGPWGQARAAAVVRSLHGFVGGFRIRQDRGRSRHPDFAAMGVRRRCTLVHGRPAAAADR